MRRARAALTAALAAAIAGCSAPAVVVAQAGKIDEHADKVHTVGVVDAKSTVGTGESSPAAATRPRACRLPPWSESGLSFYWTTCCGSQPQWASRATRLTASH
jgi:hypothetical protein